MNVLSGVVQSDAEMSGHAALISADPLIISTPSTWQTPIGLAEALGPFCANRQATFLIPVSWHCNAARASAKAAAITAHRSRFPAHRLIVLGNTLEEVATLRAAGADAFFANHNIFASEDVFRPLPNARIEFDAVYNARPSPAKRHGLASLIDRIVYIGFVGPGQEAFHSRDIFSDLLKRPGHVVANEVVDGFPRMMHAKDVNDWLARASVGLCLSEEEGAMYSSIEYMLAGLPIVSTPSEGGREVFFDRDYCIIAAPDPRSVREAVEALRDRNIPRSHVRSRTLAKLAAERQRFLTFIDEIKARHGVPQGHRTEWAFSGASFHRWRTIEQHAREILTTNAGEAVGAADIEPPTRRAEAPRQVRFGDSPRKAPAKRAGRRRDASSTVHRLVAFVGQNDSDILPFFFDHYRRLGIGAFHVMLHGTWSKAELAPLQAVDVTIEGFNGEPFDDVLLTSSLDAVARQFVGEWIVVADADEFLELPYASLNRTIDALTCLGMDELPANLLQRAAADGQLHSLAAGTPETLFPCYDYRLAERMNTELPVWKSKYPLIRIGPKFRFSQGNHHPNNGRAAMHLPIRGVLHHFKWRDRLLRSVSRKRGEVGQQQGNQEEQNSYRQWLDENDQRVPTEGLKVCSRPELFAEGHLIRPTRGELKLWSALRKARQGRRSNALANIPHAVAQPDSGAAYLDRCGLSNLPGRIALVTTDLLGLRRTGGIGTAMTALAERLAWAGHEVHVFLCPWGNHDWHPIWADHWEARGCQVHHHPLRKGWTLADASMFIADLLNASDWDVIHLAENDGLGAPLLLLRAAGLAFRNTQVVVTAHGPTRWHRHGNLVQWTESEALGSELEASSMELADVLVCPSDYIAEWCRSRFATKVPPIVVPNSLTGEGRRFGRGLQEPRPIKTIVFFGRIEVRKGIDRFLAAIDRVLEQGLSDFEVVFLGSFVSYYPPSALERRTQGWPCPTRILSNYTSHDAIDLLRTENCIAVMPSRLDNSPYCVFECLENAIPFIATDVGGVAELIGADDRARVLVSGSPDEIAGKLVDALQNGAPPAAMNFDPTHADIDLLALHGNLVGKARAARGAAIRREQPSASVIVYGPQADAAAPPLAEWLGRLGGTSIEVLWSIAPQIGAQSDWHGDANALNGAARSASHDRLFFCHTSALPDADALTALLTAMENTSADAAVCGYRFESADGVAESVAVFAGPSELSAQQNIYGAKLFLVRKALFLEAGGFSAEPSVAGIMEWELLNRLKASDRRIVGIPIALATAGSVTAPRTLTESQAGALTAPWTDAAPHHQQGFMRMALHAGRPVASPQPSSLQAEAGARELKATDLAEQVSTTFTGVRRQDSDLGERVDDYENTSPLEGIDLADDGPSRDGRLRIGSDGELLDASQTYRIQTAGDAEGCDFLIAEGLIDAGGARSLAEAVRDVEGRLLHSGDGPPPDSSFLWLREISAGRPDALEPIVDLVRRGMAQTADFYGLSAPLFPDLIQLRKLGTGMFEMPRRRAASPSGNAEGAEADGCVGHLFISDECEGGDLYFTGLDMAVEPRVGRFVAATNAPYHEQALLRVESGTLLVLSFAMRTRREEISLDLRGIF